MKTNLFFAAITSFLCIILTSCKSEREFKKERVELHRKIGLYMSGKPVEYFAFPWCKINGSLDIAVLKMYLNDKTITKEQFDEFSDPVQCWVRKGYESK